MTAIVTRATIHAVTSSAYGALSSGLGAIVVAMLIVLLFERAMMEAHGGPRFAARKSLLGAALGPLLVVFGLLIVARLGHLLRLL